MSAGGGSGQTAIRFLTWYIDSSRVGISAIYCACALLSRHVAVKVHSISILRLQTDVTTCTSFTDRCNNQNKIEFVSLFDMTAPILVGEYTI